MIKSTVLLAIVSIFIISSCGKNYSPEVEAYINKIENHRAKTDSMMQYANNSPFNLKGKVEFHPLHYFDVDTSWVYKSKLYYYESQDTLLVYGTKGEERKAVKLGYLQFSRKGKDFKLNVYKNEPSPGNIYYGIWFTDQTTNKETYGVGRYLNFEISPDSSFIYEIDFNLAYNPYCAYSSAYSCAIPTKEDFLDLAITAGELKFHE